MPNGPATSPSRIGPRPSPRSMAALAVPDAAPRCEGAAVAKIAEKKAGVLNATPTAATAAPSSRPAGDGHDAARTSPTAIVAEGRGAEGERRQPIGDARERDPADDDHAAVDEQREARVRKPHAHGVQRREGEESAHRHERGEEPERDRQGGAMDEVTLAVVGRRARPGLADEQAEARRGTASAAAPAHASPNPDVRTRISPSGGPSAMPR